MKTGTTLFQLKTDRADVFDGSTLGVSILATRNAKRAADGGLHLDRGVVELARNKALDELDAFTIEATITPEKIAGDRRNILEGQTPAVALFLEPGGKLVGSVHTPAGWVGLDSGQTVIREGETARVRGRSDVGRNRAAGHQRAGAARPRGGGAGLGHPGRQRAGARF